MLFVISPAKTLDLDTRPSTKKHTQPDFLAHAEELVGVLRGYAPERLGALMAVSPALAELNAARYQAWRPPFDAKNARQAVLTFAGDVYDGLDAPTLTVAQLTWLQKRLRILSGLYGLLRPLDLMQPYRLEMGAALRTPRGATLYAFWGDLLTETLNALAVDNRAKVLVNLASDEYFKAVRRAKLTVPVLTPVFEDWKNGQYKTISFFAKRARGLMARYAAVNGVRRAEELRGFDLDGYAWCAAASDARRWVFRRRLAG